MRSAARPMARSSIPQVMAVAAGHPRARSANPATGATSVMSHTDNEARLPAAGLSNLMNLAISASQFVAKRDLTGSEYLSEPVATRRRRRVGARPKAIATPRVSTVATMRLVSRIDNDTGEPNGCCGLWRIVHIIPAMLAHSDRNAIHRTDCQPRIRYNTTERAPSVAR